MPPRGDCQRRRGEKNGQAKLTKQQVLEIRTRHRQWKANSPRKLAERFGVTVDTISSIASGRRWSGVD
jgi:hypothetical protein